MGTGRHRHSRAATIAVCLSVSALCVAVVLGLFVLGQQSNELHRIQTNRAATRSDFCTLFEVFTSSGQASTQHGRVVTAALVKLSQEYGCSQA